MPDADARPSRAPSSRLAPSTSHTEMSGARRDPDTHGWFLFGTNRGNGAGTGAAGRQQTHAAHARAVCPGRLRTRHATPRPTRWRVPTLAKSSSCCHHYDVLEPAVGGVAARACWSRPGTAANGRTKHATRYRDGWSGELIFAPLVEHGCPFSGTQAFLSLSFISVVMMLQQY
jgi:hypothetical protein